MPSNNYYNNYRKRKKKKRWFIEIITAVAAVIMIICAYSGAVDPEKFFPAPFLMLAYMPMVVVILLLMIAAIVWRHWLAVLIALLSLTLTLPVLKYFVGMNSNDNIPPAPADPALLLKVMTYNVLSFNYNEPAGPNAKPSIKVILEADPDVVLIQEGGAAGLEWDEIPSLQPYMSTVRSRYPYLYNSPEGLNIISKYPFTTQPLCDPQYMRSVLGYNHETTSHLARAYDLQLPSGKQLRLVDFRLQSYHLSFGKNPNVRISPDAKPSAIERMRRSFALRGANAASLRKALDDSPENIIVCGDMNDVSASHVYRVICGDDLKDAWVETGRGYGHSFNRHNLPFRIDQILYRGDIRALEAKRIKDGSSDHYPVMATFDIEITK